MCQTVFFLHVQFTIFLYLYAFETKSHFYVQSPLCTFMDELVGNVDVCSVIAMSCHSWILKRKKGLIDLY